MKFSAVVIALAAFVAMNMSEARAECEQPGWSAWGFPQVAAGGDYAQRFISDPILVANADGHLEVFAIGENGELWHSWQNPAGDTWSPWTTFGAPAPGVRFSAQSGDLPKLAVVLDGYGVLQVFVAEGSGFWTISQAVRNANWGAWRQITPTAPGYANVQFSAAGIWATLSGTELTGKEVVVFTVNGVNNGLVTLWSNGELHDFGWPGTPSTDFRRLSLEHDEVGAIVLATVGGGTAYVRRQNGPITDDDLPDHPHTYFDGWDQWRPLGRPSGVSALAYDTALLAQNQDRRLELLVRDQSSLAYWHTWQVPGGAWTGAWHSFGATPTHAVDTQFAQGRGACLTLVSVVQSEESGNPFRLAPLYQHDRNAGWNGWGTLSPRMYLAYQTIGHAAIARGTDGYLQVFVRGRDAANREIMMRARQH